MGSTMTTTNDNGTAEINQRLRTVRCKCVRGASFGETGYVSDAALDVTGIIGVTFPKSPRTPRQRLWYPAEDLEIVFGPLRK